MLPAPREEAYIFPIPCRPYSPETIPYIARLVAQSDLALTDRPARSTSKESSSICLRSIPRCREWDQQSPYLGFPERNQLQQHDRFVSPQARDRRTITTRSNLRSGRDHGWLDSNAQSRHFLESYIPAGSGHFCWVDVDPRHHGEHRKLALGVREEGARNQ